VSRRRSTTTRSSQAWARDERRLREARQTAAPVTVRYVCPRCGGDHHAHEHDLHGARGLTADELRRLRQQVAEETLLAVRRGADAAVLAQFAGLADALDTRLADLDRHATVAHRQRVAAEAGANPATLYAT
jgi:hypothetical protein